MTFSLYPGTAGGDWTDDDVESTRIRLLEAVHPDWRVSQTLYGYGARTLRITENKILRLAFHDCAKYTGKKREKRDYNMGLKSF